MHMFEREALLLPLSVHTRTSTKNTLYVVCIFNFYERDDDCVNA